MSLSHIYYTNSYINIEVLHYRIYARTTLPHNALLLLLRCVSLNLSLIISIITYRHVQMDDTVPNS